MKYTKTASKQCQPTNQRNAKTAVSRMSTLSVTNKHNIDTTTP